MCCVFDFFNFFHLLFDGALVWVGTKFVVACVFELPIDEVKSCHELRPRSLSSLPRIHEENNTDKEVGDWCRSLQQS
jgi:hypothetical protein